MTTNVNPFEPSEALQNSVPSLAKPHPMRWFAIGMLIGAAVPLTLGLLMLYQFRAYQATLPAGRAVCGTPALGAIFLILFGTPIGSFVGGFLGLIAQFTATGFSRLFD